MTADQSERLVTALERLASNTYALGLGPTSGGGAHPGAIELVSMSLKEVSSSIDLVSTAIERVAEAFELIAAKMPQP